MPFVKLVETSEKDYEEYYTIRCSPADIYWNGYTDRPNKEKFKALFNERLSSSRFTEPEDRRIYLLRNEFDDKNIGFVQLIKRTDAVEIGCSVTEAFQRRGYATEALRLALVLAKDFSNNIFLSIRDDNIASIKASSKAGFYSINEYILKEYPECGMVILRKYVSS